MALTTFNYSIAAMPAGRVAADRLIVEIRDKTEILTALEGVAVADDGLAIVFRDALSIDEVDALDDVVAAHSGEPLPNANFDTEGNPVVAPTFMHTTERARLAGFTFVADDAQASVLDIEISSRRLVQGATFWVSDCIAGDRGSLSVVDKNDVLGLHTANGIPLGTPIELVKYAANMPMPTAALHQESAIMDTVSSVPAGLFIRCTYEAVAASAPQRVIGITFRWYLDG